MPFIEFAENEFRLGNPPPRDPSAVAQLANMKDNRFDHLEKLSIVVIKGPLKGFRGTVISVGITRIAHVEMRVISFDVNKLQQIRLDHMAFELYVLSSICVLSVLNFIQRAG